MLDNKMNDFIENNLEDMLKDLAELIEIESVESAPAPGAPYGQQVRRALDKSLEIAAKLGLKTCDGDGYVGYGELSGNSRQQGYLAAISHTDVVPAGQGWNFEPFKLTQKDGWLIGRGTDDDKNAVIITLYAAKFLRENITLDHDLRILLGCNEETGMHDVPYYLAHNKQPLFCLTPDVFFPACNGEKGIYAATLKSGPLSGNVLDIRAGEAANAVPGSACAVIKTEKSLPPSAGIQTEQEDGAIRINAAGRGGHASEPEDCINAIGILVDYLLANDLLTKNEIPFFELLGKLFDGCKGTSLGLSANDDVFHELTCVGGTIRMENGEILQTVDIRYPLTITWEEIDNILRAQAKDADAELSVDKASAPFYMDEKYPPLQACLKTYNNMMNRDERPEVIGGATYSRLFSHAIGFGLDDMNEKAPDFIGMLHGPNEGFSIHQFKIALKAYILAFAVLDKINYDEI